MVAVCVHVQYIDVKLQLTTCNIIIKWQLVLHMPNIGCTETLYTEVLY